MAKRRLVDPILERIGLREQKRPRQFPDVRLPGGQATAFWMSPVCPVAGLKATCGDGFSPLPATGKRLARTPRP